MRRFSCLLIFLLFLAASIVEAQSPRSAKDHVKRGLSRFSKGDLDGAIAAYDRAIEIIPQLAEAHLNRGKARRAKGDLNGAIEDYEKAIEIDPHTAVNNRDITQAYTNRGYIKSNQLDVDGALADFNKAIKYSPNDADTYFKRGRALLI